MEGLAKTAESVDPIAPQIGTNLPPQTSNHFLWEGVPLDVFHFFNVEISNSNDKTNSEMKDIYKWASQDANGKMGDVMEKLRSLETRLGVPRLGETRIGKMSNWIRLSTKIDDIRKHMRAYEHGDRI